MILGKSHIRQIILEEIDKQAQQEKNSNEDMQKLFADLDRYVGAKIKSLASEPAPSEQAETEKSIKQEGFLSTVGLAAAMPKILSGFSSLAGYFKFVKTEKQLLAASEFLHHKYLDGIKFLLEKFAGDRYNKAPKEKQDLIAELVFMAIVCLLMWYSAYQFGEALATKFTSMGLKGSIGEAILAAIKSKELYGFLVKESEKILGIV